MELDVRSAVPVRADRSGQQVRVAIVADGSVAMLGAAAVLGRMVRLAAVQVVRTAEALLCRVADQAPIDVVITNPYDIGNRRPYDNSALLFAQLPVLAFCPPLDQVELVALIRMGVRGYLSWDSVPVRLAEAVRAVSSNGFYLPWPVVAELVHGEPPAEPALAPREREVLRSVAAGLTHKEIADRLGLSKATVDTYVQRIRQKLKIGNKAELVQAAHRFGLVS